MTVPASNYPASPPANLPSGAEQPLKPSIAGQPRPSTGHVVPPLTRTLPQRIAAKIAQWCGFADYTAEVAERLIPVVIVGDLSKNPIDEETRSGADYKVFLVDLSVARTRIPLEGTQDMVMANVALVQLTANGTFRLHVGDRDGILFGSTGLGIGGGIEMQPPEQTRLSITNTAQPATTAELMVSAGVRVSL